MVWNKNSAVFPSCVFVNIRSNSLNRTRSQLLVQAGAKFQVLKAATFVSIFSLILWPRSVYTARKATGLMQVVDFIGLMQVCHHVVSSLLASSSCIKPVGFVKLYQACWLHQVASSLLASSSCIKPVGFIKLHQACWLHQVASSLLASSSCIKPVGFIKLHQACWLHQVASSLLASSSCIKPVGFIKLHQACWLRQVASSLLASSSYIKPVGFIKLHQACDNQT